MYKILIKGDADIMSINFDKSFIFSGNDFKLTEYLTLHHPTINEILSLNNGYNCEGLYWKYIQSIMCDPYSNMVMLDDLGKNFIETSPFEVFILQWENCQKDYMDNQPNYDLLHIHPTDFIIAALNFFIVEKYNYKMNTDENGNFYLYDADNPNYKIDENLFNYLYEWLQCINKIDYSNRIKPADENARRILIEDMRDEIKKRKRRRNKSDDNIEYIGRLMSAVSFGGNGVITPFNIKDCKVFWLFESQNVESKKSHAAHILDGLYHGTIRSKDIDKKELDWIS